MIFNKQLIALALFAAGSAKAGGPCDGVGPGHVFVPTDDCKGYYQCVNGRQYGPQNCHPSLLWNSAKNTCDWPQNVDCGGGTPPVEGPDEECEDYPEGNVYLPVESDCTKFARCVDGVYYPPQPCAGGTVFAGGSPVCDHPYNLDENDDCYEALEEPETPAPDAECVSHPTGSVFLPTPDCSTYGQCVDGTYFERDCADGTVSGADVNENGAGVCDHPYNLPDTDACFEEAPAPEEPEAPEEPDAECESHPTGFLATDDCTTFGECANGKYYEKDCPEGRVSSSDANFPDNGSPCVHPYSLPTDDDCYAEAPAPEEPEPPQPDPECVGVPGDVFLPTDDCATYARCANGVYYPSLDCAPGTVSPTDTNFPENGSPCVHPYSLPTDDGCYAPVPSHLRRNL